jgi:hypothetical protein
MKLKDSNPDIKYLPLKEFIDSVKWNTIFSMFSQIADYYDSRLSLISILNYYGLDIDKGSEEIQVQCLFLEHGSEDRNKSARYYSYDRTTGEPKEGVYCFKCQKYYTSFWYLYKLEREYKKLNLLDFFLWVDKIFKVNFPKKLVLEFDPESFYSFENLEDKQNILDLFKYAKDLRRLKEENKNIYLGNLINFYQTMKIRN